MKNKKTLLWKKCLFLGTATAVATFATCGTDLKPAHAQQNSSVQEELKKLYEQNGRGQAPDMRMQSLPRTTPDGRTFEATPQQGVPAQSQPVAQQPQVRQTTPQFQQTSPQAPQVAQTPEEPKKRRGLLNKLFNWKKNRAEAKQEQTVAPPQPVVQQPVQQQPELQQPVAPQPRQVLPIQQPVRNVAQPTYQQPRVTQPTYQQVQQPQPLNQNAAQQSAPVMQAAPFPNELVVQPASQPRVIQSGPLPIVQPNQNGTYSAPQPQQSTVANPFATEQAPIIPAQPVAQPARAMAQPAAALPNLDELPNEPLPIGPKAEPKPAPVVAVDETFPDPFTEMSETEADGGNSNKPLPELVIEERPILPAEPQQPKAATLPVEEKQTAELPVAEEDAKPAPKPVAVQPKPVAKALPLDDAKPLPIETAEEPAVETPEPVVVEQPAVEEENPFSGLKLDSPAELAPIESAKPAEKSATAESVKPAPAKVASAPELPIEGDSPQAEQPQVAPALPTLDPAFEDEFQLPRKAETAEAAMPKLEKIPDAKEAQEEAPAAELGDISWEEEEARRSAKLKLIAARGGETGLKGFCIVALRDSRDLVDAVPAFRSTYNLRTYHFCNLESKIDFDKEPKKYVPAYDGNDPILLSTQSEEREGSLDHALWFKGRLYLFTTGQNLEVFQRDPVLYAEN